MGATGLISEKTEVLYAELNGRAEVATSSYSVSGDSLHYIYSVLVTKNHRNIQSRCLVHEFSFTDIFNDINHGYRAAILKKNSLWLLPFYMVVATYFYYEKVRRTMRTAIVSNLLNVSSISPWRSPVLLKLRLTTSSIAKRTAASWFSEYFQNNDSDT